MPAGNAITVLGFSPGVKGTRSAPKNLRRWETEKLCEDQFNAKIPTVVCGRHEAHTNEASTGKLFLGQGRQCIRVDLHPVPVLLIHEDVKNDGACSKAREVRSHSRGNGQMKGRALLAGRARPRGKGSSKTRASIANPEKKALPAVPEVIETSAPERPAESVSAVCSSGSDNTTSASTYPHAS